MKFIITESRRNRAITKWLDDNYGNLIKLNNTSYWGKINGVYEQIFEYRKDWVKITDEELQNSLLSMFGVNKESLKEIFIPWLEERYNLKVSEVQYNSWYCETCNKYHPTKHHIDD